MNAKKDLPIYVLSVAIVLSTWIYTTQDKNTDNGKPKPNTTTANITEEKYKSDMKIVIDEVVKLGGRMSSVEECLSETTRRLTSQNQVTRWCP